jgi:anti-anti-sigma factor
MDFEDVRWINSTGVGVIIACLTALRREGGDINFANLHDMPQRYFQLTKLDTVVKIFDSLTEAVENFAVTEVT